MQKNKLKELFRDTSSQLPHKAIQGQVAWRSPSNIAFVKYWGKYGIQLPKNPSLSMTLSASYTETRLIFKTAVGQPQRLFLFEGKENEAFSKRIWKFIDSLSEFFPFLDQLDLQIASKNSFPHSAGIASSASAMSALALCLVDMHQLIFEQEMEAADFYKHASFIARLGSGSAARSVYGGFSIWGSGNSLHLETNNDFAVVFNQKVSPVFEDLQDAILIVDEGQKKVSSSVGHSLMNGHPYAENRLMQANKNIVDLSNALVKGHKESFIKILESEALSLHALMMSSDPWFILMKPQTLQILEKIKSYREQRGIFLAFTLDAGPNVHLIYSKDDEKEIKAFIDKELKVFCKNEHIIFDAMGNGPKKIM